jgi:hypothetical protein
MSLLARFGELLVIVAVLLVSIQYAVAKVVPTASPDLNSFYSVLHVSTLTEFAFAGIGIMFIVFGIAVGRATQPRPRAIRR